MEDFKLTEKQKAKILKKAEKAEFGDLEGYLHHVGDDCVKSEVEDILHELLDEKSFKIVLAAFYTATH